MRYSRKALNGILLKNDRRTEFSFRVLAAEKDSLTPTQRDQVYLKLDTYLREVQAEDMFANALDVLAELGHRYGRYIAEDILFDQCEGYALACGAPGSLAKFADEASAMLYWSLEACPGSSPSVLKSLGPRLFDRLNVAVERTELSEISLVLDCFRTIVGGCAHLMTEKGDFELGKYEREFFTALAGSVKSFSQSEAVSADPRVIKNARSLLEILTKLLDVDRSFSR
jgi:hypothetical protein